jgi:adenylosuccinate lyase
VSHVTYPNVLASRYASQPMAELWSAEHKVVLERRLWIAVLRAQADLGVDVPDGVVAAYEAVVDQVERGGVGPPGGRTPHHEEAPDQ